MTLLADGTQRPWMPWSSSRTVVPGRVTSREVSDGVQDGWCPALKHVGTTGCVDLTPREDMGPVSDQAAGMRSRSKLRG